MNSGKDTTKKAIDTVFKIVEEQGGIYTFLSSIGVNEEDLKTLQNRYQNIWGLFLYCKVYLSKIVILIKILLEVLKNSIRTTINERIYSSKTCIVLTLFI